MGKIVVVALLAAVAGGAIVYGVMLYMGDEPVSVADVVDKAREDIGEPEPEKPDPSPAPQESDGSTNPAAVNRSPPPAGAPTGTALPPPTALPTIAPTVPASSAREAVVDAFANCGGQYSGADRDFRARAAASAIADGRQSVEDIRALVAEHCGGVTTDVTPATALSREQPAPTAAPVPTRTAAATPMPAGDPETGSVASPDLRHIEAKRFMLDLINAERRNAGVGVVTLGGNIAAQVHAEAALDNCFSGHWGMDGLKPYMRYSLAGGYQSNGENGSGLDYCIKASDFYQANQGIRQEIQRSMEIWMQSPGHRRNILDPRHKMVNIGLAWDDYNTAMYQHFERDYVHYDVIPQIAHGSLTMAGNTRNGAGFGHAEDLGVQIYYDPPPHRLTRGQVARTYCYDYGVLVASLREPLSGGYQWTTHDFETTHDPCPDPYDVPPETPGPGSYEEAHQAWHDAYATSQSLQPQAITVPWVTASRLQASGTKFAVTADISKVLDRHGDGVYSIMVWARIDGHAEVISEYSIFHGVKAPDSYGNGAR